MNATIIATHFIPNDPEGWFVTVGRDRHGYFTARGMNVEARPTYMIFHRSATETAARAEANAEWARMVAA